MDVTLKGVSDIEPSMHLAAREIVNQRKEKERDIFDKEILHPEAGDDYVTFWPDHNTEVSIEYLKWYVPDILVPHLEVRSTLRRAGPDNGPITLLVNEDNDMCISVRNAQRYPVSMEKGMKIAQIFWKSRTIDNFGNYVRNLGPFSIGSGVPICSTDALEKLISQGELSIHPKPEIQDGLLIFHAGSTVTYNDSEHVVLRKKGTIMELN